MVLHGRAPQKGGYPMPASVDVFEAIRTARMLRVLKPDPVPDALIERILEAAICAPSAGNAQAWSFIAVTNETQRRRLGDAYRRASVSVRDFYAAQGRPAHMSDAQFLRVMRSGIHLHEHMGEAPVSFLPCMLTVPRALPDSIPARLDPSGDAGPHARQLRARRRSQRVSGRSERHPRL